MGVFLQSPQDHAGLAIIVEVEDGHHRSRTRQYHRLGIGV
jgi:hypothetical protein